MKTHVYLILAAVILVIAVTVGVAFLITALIQLLTGHV